MLICRYCESILEMDEFLKNRNCPFCFDTVKIGQLNQNELYKLTPLYK